MRDEKGTLWHNQTLIGEVLVDSISVLGLPRAKITFPLQSQYTGTVRAYFSSKRKLRKWVISFLKNPRYRGPRKTT